MQESEIFKKTYKEFYMKYDFDYIPVIKDATEEEVLITINKLITLSFITKINYLNGNISYIITKRGCEMYENFYDVSIKDSLMRIYYRFINK